MPKLLVFLPCERVIINPEDNNTTLITVLSEIRVSAASQPSKLPPGARGILARWQILTTWLREPADEGKEFEQGVVLVTPDGEGSDPARSVFKMELRGHRVTTTILGFPISKTPGECLLRLSLRSREYGQDAWSDWQERATYPILLKFMD